MVYNRYVYLANTICQSELKAFTYIITCLTSCPLPVCVCVLV